MEFAHVPVGDIVVNRETRQRKRIVIDEGFRESIRKRGVIQPIIVKRETMELMAGERRLTASKECGHATVPVRFFEDLDPYTSAIIELEENIKRSDLDWRDEVSAIAAIHALYCASQGEWTLAKTAESINLPASWISKCNKVYRELASPKLALSTGIEQAYRILARSDERIMGDVLSDIVTAGANAINTQDTSLGTLLEPSPSDAPGPAAPNRPVGVGKIMQAEDSILQEDFLEWAPSYRGKPFSFIHCDFPFGVGVFDGQWGGGASHQTYDDTEKTYWNLFKCLTDNLDRLLAASGHIMFWFSMDYYSDTLSLFRINAPSLAMQNFPLIWHKTDNVGIAPDAKRQPRRVYETCFVGAREDRPLVKCISNTYGAQTDKRYHPSTKPEPMLRHFMQLFIDEGTTMLDPTCGSGSSLRAAESLGAKRVLGLERDPEHCENARKALRQFRALRAFEK